MSQLSQLLNHHPHSLFFLLSYSLSFLLGGLETSLHFSLRSVNSNYIDLFLITVTLILVTQVLNYPPYLLGTRPLIPLFTYSRDSIYCIHLYIKYPYPYIQHSPYQCIHLFIDYPLHLHTVRLSLRYPLAVPHASRTRP